jgi:hypothetical protein
MATFARLSIDEGFNRSIERNTRPQNRQDGFSSRGAAHFGGKA